MTINNPKNDSKVSTSEKLIAIQERHVIDEKWMQENCSVKYNTWEMRLVKDRGELLDMVDELQSELNTITAAHNASTGAVVKLKKAEAKLEAVDQNIETLIDKYLDPDCTLRIDESELLAITGASHE